jgi:pimeloyl-ACP methyl ester carboxylesterase
MTDDFLAAYDAVLSRWPGPVEPVEVGTPFGSTHVNVYGPVTGTPLVLLHGGGATSTVWLHNVEALAREHRIFAVDQVGDAGRSRAEGRPIRSRADFMAWLDAVLGGLGLDRVRLCGHSYGAWLALNYALHAPERVGRLVLLDPTQCFAGMSLSYRLHAVPLFARPSAERLRAFLAWETGGAPLDPGWLDLFARAAEYPRAKIVMPRRPPAGRLRNLRVRTLVVVAEKTRSHHPAKVARGARLLPDAVVTVLPGATHHTIPTEQAELLNDRLVRFLS